ncbi:AraC family transcriptional regulator (plasmid) [Hymenobacter psoromatis]|nr:AraC family transcriptional regulator [Hymenobacter psoromatis]
MSFSQLYRFKTITEYHRLMGLPPPEHPLLSVVRIEAVQPPVVAGPVSLVFEFYAISLKRVFNARFKYGQQTYDFDEGVMFFMAPGQVFGIEIEKEATQLPAGWMVLVHPDFLWKTSLSQKIRQYEFFAYSVHEALFLSAKEEATVTQLMHYIEQEYHANIDPFSQNIIISHLEALLHYAERFYQRQFITRRVANHQLLNRLEELLAAYFIGNDLSQKGLPTVGYVAEALHVSADYLSGMLKVLTGLTTQQHIHEHLLQRAKEKLSTTELSVGEIAYQLGFEHAPSFSRLFKSKTNLSPLAFRQSFN